MTAILSCLNCAKPIQQASKGRRKVFCSDSCRAESWRLGIEATPCFYCGDKAETTDHIPPRAYRKYIAEQPDLKMQYPEKEIKACKECNCLLGTRALWTVEVRKRYIKKALRKRYKKDLARKPLTPTDLEDVGFNLRQILQAGEARRLWVQARLLW